MNFFPVNAPFFADNPVKSRWTKMTPALENTGKYVYFTSA
jgi:hypothetical protein